MDHALLKQYIRLTEFLGLALGPDYEISLYNCSGQSCTMTAIVHSDVSGSDLDTAISPRELEQLFVQAETRDFCTNYETRTRTGKPLHTSVFFIRTPGGDLSGLLCLRFDDSKFRDLTEQLFRLLHPGNEMEHQLLLREELPAEQELPPTPGGHASPVLSSSVTDTARAVIQDVLETEGFQMTPGTRLKLKQSEKLRLVKKLDQRGIFKVRGSVDYLCEVIRSSPASIYRYLNQVREE